MASEFQKTWQSVGFNPTLPLFLSGLYLTGVIFVLN